MTGPGACILIVDDEVKNRKLLEVLLQHEGYRTVSAASGDEALALIERGAPDLILLDVMMPQVDGYQVARILKAHPSSLSIPIIMISAQGDRQARLAGLNAGAEEFLSKPIDRDELWLRVRNLLRLKSDGDLIRHNSALLEERVQARTADLQRFRTAMDATADLLALVDRESMRFIEVNASACTLLGYTREELLTMSPAHLVRGAQDDAELARIYDTIIAGGGPQPLRETLIRKKDGSDVCVEVNLQAVQAGERWTIVSVSRDITERKEAEAKLQQLAHYDPLTRLPNRRLFQESLSRAIEQADALDLQVVLLYLDLDDFKDVNDSLGHVVGDELLCQVGERLLASLYVRDSVGRLGGDEFGIIVQTPRDPDVAMLVAEKVRTLLRAPFDLHGHLVRTSASIGIAVYPTDTADADVMASYADMAMYEAKRSGKNASRFYTAAMNQRVRDKLTLVDALRDALERDEFVLHYQPKVSLRTGRWTGVEALLRWDRPGHGLVHPAVFIPALEESDLIIPVGAWIVATACRQLADWQVHGPEGLPIAVNVSARQIGQGDRPVASELHAAGHDASDGVALLSAVAACFAEHPAASGLLDIELTESVVMADAEHSIEVLRKLVAMGVRLSVDDFGTGYSSLSYLRRFPLQAVKIDGSFIRELTTNAEDASIAVAIIEMAHRLKLEVIAECVESVEQMEFLQAHGCDQAQGYYFAAPMPLAELEALWRESDGEVAWVAREPGRLHESHIAGSAWPESVAFEAALMSGSRDEARAIIDRQTDQGHALIDVGLHLVQPALYRIGEKWRTGQINVAQEHVATALALSVMAQSVWREPQAKPNGNKVLLACVDGNHHAVGLQMVADAFTLSGWNVAYLGANVPGDALAAYVQQSQPDLLGLSVTMPQHVRELRKLVQYLRHTLGECCPPVFVGGQGFTAADQACSEFADVTWHVDSRSAVALGEKLCRPGAEPPAANTEPV